MAHYLFRLLGERDPFSAMIAGGLGGPEGGRMGDYDFDQEGQHYATATLGTADI